MKKVSRKGFTLVELLVVIGILGILMGALFPVISSAMLNANLSTMAMQGRKLIQGMIQANIERQGKLGLVWPKDQDENSSNASSDDIASKGASTTTQYFKDLFDIDHYGTSEWDPTVDGDLISSLSGCGVQGMSGKSLEKNNIAWVIAKNIVDETQDFIPVLITRNADFSTLNGYLNAFDGQNDTKLTLGKNYDQPFANKGCVLVRKSGAADQIKQKYARLNLIFNNQGFDNSSREKKLEFLDL